MSNKTKGAIAVISGLVMMIIGLWVITDEIIEARKPKYAFEMNECIAATANIQEFKNRNDSAGYPVAIVKAITEDGYAVLVFIPDLNFYATYTVPFSMAKDFQSVHCPEALGGDEI